MCGSIVDIQSTAAEIRRGKKERRKIEITGQKYIWPALLHIGVIRSSNKVGFDEETLTTLLFVAVIPAVVLSVTQISSVNAFLTIRTRKRRITRARVVTYVKQ